MKQCNTCGGLFERSMFHVRNAAPDGLSNKCKDCVKQYDINHRKENNERIKAYDRHRYQINQEKKILYQLDYYQKNKEKIQQYDKKRKPERFRRARVAYYLYSANRCRRRKEATVSWIDKNVVKDIFLLAQEFREAGFKVHVDHIVPLKGKNVCGLHVHNNLRVCLAKNNLEKFNKHDESLQAY